MSAGYHTTMPSKPVIRCLPSLLVSLDREASENGEPTAHGLLKFMKCYKFVASLYLLSDVLPHLSRLSRIFQKENVDLSLIQPCLKTTIDAIKQYVHKSLGQISAKWIMCLQQIWKNSKSQLLMHKKKPSSLMFKQSTFKLLLTSWTTVFPHVELLDAFSIFDPHTLPSEEEELAAHGPEKLEVLTTFYGSSSWGINPEACASEWECLKRLMYNKYSSLTHRQMLRLLCAQESLRDMFPQLTKLSAIAALIPISTAECERAFSAMKRIKTDLRNRLKTSTLDCLMRITIEGPPASNFNFWKSSRHLGWDAEQTIGCWLTFKFIDLTWCVRVFWCNSLLNNYKCNNWDY